MIHEYLLQPDEFWKDYIILDFAIPKVKQQKDLLDEYHRLIQVNPLESQDKLKLLAYKKLIVIRNLMRNVLKKLKVLL